MRSRSNSLPLKLLLALALLLSPVLSASVVESHGSVITGTANAGILTARYGGAVDSPCDSAQHDSQISITIVAGKEFDATTVFTSPADGFHAIGLTYIVPPGWTARVDVSLTDPPAMMALTPKNGEAVYVWAGPYDAGVEFTAVYKVEAPIGAEPGVYTFGGSLEYYIEPYPAPSYVEVISGSVHVDIAAASTITIEGVIEGVDGAILSRAAVTLYRNGEAIASAISDENGRYVLECSEPADYDLVVSREGFRTEARSISATELKTYVMDFSSDSGLIPHAPSKTYVLTCVDLWMLDGPSPRLSTARLLDVISASKYPSG